MAIDRFVGQFRFLSNFYPVEIVRDGQKYPTVEHAFQAAKTHDPVERRTVRECRTPGRAKRAGRRVTKREDWDGVRVSVMKELLWQKFQRPDLKEALLATGTELLIEGNDWGDVFWGQVDGEGENMLGRLIMEIRFELRG